MVSATNFDGTDFFLRGAELTGASDGTVGLFSCWLRPTGSSGSRVVITNLLSRFFVQHSVGEVFLFMETSAGTDLISVRSVSSLSLDVWTHVLVSWDTGTNRAQIYLNDVDDTDTPITNTSGTIDYTTGNWGVGAISGGDFKFDGCMSELYLNTAETLDISTEANRRNFITANLGPEDLGADGSTPTGTAPIVYLPNPFGSFGTNAGTGGDFTDQGSVAACADTPVGTTPLTPGLSLKPFVLPDGRRFADEGEARVEYARLIKQEALICQRLETEKRETARLLAIEMAKPRLPDNDWRVSPKQKAEPAPAPARSRTGLLDSVGQPRLYKD